MSFVPAQTPPHEVAVDLKCSVRFSASPAHRCWHKSEGHTQNRTHAPRNARPARKKDSQRSRMSRAALPQDLRLGAFLLSVSRSSFAAGGGGTAPFSTMSFAGISLP